MKTVIKRRYLKGRLWKITESLIPTYQRPFNSIKGFRFVKIYEKRSGIGEPFSFVRGSRSEGAVGIKL